MSRETASLLEVARNDHSSSSSIALLFLIEKSDYNTYDTEEELKQKLGIPGEMEVSALLPLGYPQGHFGPTKRQPVETVMHWDRWQPKS